MASDDEFRRVGEDVRALARSLGRDLRAAFDQARDEFNRGGGSRHASYRAARDDLAEMGRAARRDFRQARAGYRHSPDPYLFPDAPPPNPADRLDVGPEGHDADELAGRRTRFDSSGPPRFDAWGGGRYRSRRSTTGLRGFGRPNGWGPPAGAAGWRPPESPVAMAVRKPAPPAKASPPPLRHRHDGSTVLGLLAVVFGLAGLAAATGVAHISGEVVAAIALMVLGASMVVTARTDWALSRRSWPIFGGVVLGLALVVFAVVPALPVGFRHVRFGSTTDGYTSWAQVPSTIQAGAGKNVIDLTGIQTPLTVARTLTVANGAGSIVIEVPVSQPVTVHARVVAGSIDVNGLTTSGLGRVVDQTFGPTSGAVLTLQVRAGFGQVVVNQGPLGAAVPVPGPGPIKVPVPANGPAKP